MSKDAQSGTPCASVGVPTRFVRCPASSSAEVGSVSTVLSLEAFPGLEFFVTLGTCFSFEFILKRTPVASAAASLGQAFVAVVA